MPAGLTEALAEGQGFGFLGPGPLGPQIEHALAFDPLLAGAGRVIDLGSGGGLPGLVLAVARPGRVWVLLDANRRRARFLDDWVRRLGMEATVTVLWGRAEEIGRDPEHREMYDGAVARSFGPPAVTAECASPFLHVGGVLVASEPPGDDRGRWPSDGLASVGLERTGSSWAPALASLRKVTETPGTVPRRVGVPVKRPLWTSGG